MMAASLALTSAVVAHAYYLKHQFYPTVVYLTKSSPSMAVSVHASVAKEQGFVQPLGVSLQFRRFLVPFAVSPG